MWVVKLKHKVIFSNSKHASSDSANSRNRYTRKILRTEDGQKDILIACVDRLKGLPGAINTVFPKTQVQLCILPT